MSPAWRYPLLRRLLACADAVAAGLASLSLGLAGGGDVGQLVWSLAWIPAWIVLAKLLGLYDRDEYSFRHTTIDEAPSLAALGATGAALLAVFLSLTPAGRPDVTRVLVVGAVAALSLVVLRGLARAVWRSATPPERLALVGSGGPTRTLKRKLELYADLHATIVDEREALDFDAEQAVELLRTVDRLVYLPTSLDDDRMEEVLKLARAAGCLVSVIPPSRGLFTPAVRVSHVAELPVLDYRSPSPSPSTLFLKRVIDVLVSGAALLVLLPLFACIAAAIKLDSRGPVFFTQIRAGVGGRPFRMIKFRSMVVDAEELLHNLVSLDGLSEPMFKLHDDPRATRLGRILRRWSLDELPQLWNVLAGQMSVVGPRPEQLDIVDRYEPQHRHRLAMKPGLTGPMQVYGRGELTFGERLAIERDYFENVTIGRDLRLIAMTVPAVLTGKGAF